MNLPDGTHLAYVVCHEAWYASHDPPTVTVQASAKGQGGGVAWEFNVEDGTEPIGRTSLHLKVWDDAWTAWTDVPELFQALTSGGVATLEDLRALLDSLGAVDETARQRPGARRDVPAEASWSTAVNAVIVQDHKSSQNMRLDPTQARQLAYELVAAADEGEGHSGGVQ